MGTVDNQNWDPDRISANLNRALLQAELEALRRSQVQVQPEDVLLGILHQPKAADSAALKALQALGVSPALLASRLGGNSRPAPQVDLRQVHLTPSVRAQNATANAFEISDSAARKEVGTGAMLVSLFRDPSGSIRKIFKEFGVDERALITAVDVQQRASLDSKRIGVTRTQAALPVTPLVQGNAILDQFGTNMAARVAKGDLDPVIGREEDVQKIFEFLQRRNKANVVIVGDPGVGKTAVIEEVQRRMLSDDCPEKFRGKVIYTIDVAAMVAGARYRGEFEERLKKVLKQISDDPNIIPFFDEIHSLLDAGAAEGAMDAATLLKPLLARPGFRCLGATTTKEYRKYLQKDAAFSRRFSALPLDEPTVEQTIEILKGQREANQSWHAVTLPDETLEAAARLADRYLKDLFMPDKAIDLVDIASARVRIGASRPEPAIEKVRQQLDELDAARQASTSDAKRTELEKEAERLLAELYTAEAADKTRKSQPITVTPDDIAAVVSALTKIPATKLNESEMDRLRTLEDTLHERVIGQEDAITALSQAVRRSRTGLSDPSKPQGSFIFLGPTGVGKTETAKALAEALFGDERHMVRIDMGEYMEKHSVSRLVGSPPGYVGHDDGGQLTEAVHKNPYSVVLLDEVEKAHPDVFNILLQMLDDGRLTDGQGRTVDFTNTIVIMSSNLGSSFRTPGQVAGKGMMGPGASLVAQATGPASSLGTKIDARTEGMLKEHFRPEFLNRIDDIIQFQALSQNQIGTIVDIQVRLLQKRAAAGETSLTLDITPAAREALAQQGYQPALGARPLKRLMQRLIETPLSELIVGGKAKSGDTVRFDVDARTRTITHKVVPGKALRTTAAPKPTESVPERVLA